MMVIFLTSQTQFYMLECKSSTLTLRWERPPVLPLILPSRSQPVLHFQVSWTLKDPRGDKKFLSSHRGSLFFFVLFFRDVASLLTVMSCVRYLLQLLSDDIIRERGGVSTSPVPPLLTLQEPIRALRGGRIIWNPPGYRTERSELIGWALWVRLDVLIILQKSSVQKNAEKSEKEKNWRERRREEISFSLTHLDLFSPLC